MCALLIVASRKGGEEGRGGSEKKGEGRRKERGKEERVKEGRWDK